jgi:succinyl-CoA synthetase beta subunit
VDLYEYQGKATFARFGMPVPQGEVADSVEAAVAAAGRLGYPVVVKAQVLTGGRGKAGGVRLAAGEAELTEVAGAILGLDIKGHVVHRLWIEQASAIAREYYASFTLDRTAKDHLCMLSARGGMEIEELAETDPGAIVRRHVDPLAGFTAADAAAMVAEAGIDEAARDGVAAVLVDLWRCYDEGDADLVEINPLILTDDGRVVALDAKVTLDDSAAFRHPEWADYANLEALDHRERLAREKGLQYVGLDGTVGVIANGAGLAMSTCDVVQQVGGSPANFLDIGGGASAEVMANALQVIATDERVRSIFVNVFGGITRGEEVGKGIAQALQEVHLDAPIVVRLDGTNAEEGRAILEGLGSARLEQRPTMLEAARRAVELAGEAAR